MKLRPGDAISEKQVALAHGLSRTPVREAIQRLADEGLIEIFPQSGTFVSRIPYEDLPEAMLIRKALESTTTRLAAERATRSQMLTLASIVERQREASAAEDTDAFHEADEGFHAKIAEVSGHPGIWRLVLQVKVQVDRFRQLTLALPHRMVDVIADHEKVLERIEASDPDGAVSAMIRHLDAVLPALDEIKRLDREAKQPKH